MAYRSDQCIHTSSPFPWLCIFCLLSNFLSLGCLGLGILEPSGFPLLFSFRLSLGCLILEPSGFPLLFSFRLSLGCLGLGILASLSFSVPDCPLAALARVSWSLLTSLCCLAALACVSWTSLSFSVSACCLAALTWVSWTFQFPSPFQFQPVAWLPYPGAFWLPHPFQFQPVAWLPWRTEANYFLASASFSLTGADCCLWAQWFVDIV